MKPLSIIAVDDEPLALRRIELLLPQVPDVRLIGTASSGEEALPMIGAGRPDVVLLDVRMGGIDGFDVIAALEGLNLPQMIFVTAYDAYAARAFAVSATDYLVKPVELPRLRAALAKARERRDTMDSTARLHAMREQLTRLQEERSLPPPEQELWVERRGEFVRLLAHEVDWVQAERDYVYLHAQGSPYLVRNTMTAMEHKLGQGAFLRIHRSALVRRDRIAAIRNRGYGDMRVQLLSGEELRVGRTYQRKLRGLLAEPAR